MNQIRDFLASLSTVLKQKQSCSRNAAERKYAIASSPEDILQSWIALEVLSPLKI